MAKFFEDCTYGNRLLWCPKLELLSTLKREFHELNRHCRYKGNRVAVKTLLVLPTDRGVDQLNDSDRIFAETAAEAEALSKLRHENMMRFYGICFLREQHSIAMVTELCDVDLRTWIDAIGGHTDREIWKVAIQIGKVRRFCVFLFKFF